MSEVAIIGGCGRLGLRFSLIAATKGHKVLSIDIDEERINEIKQGCLPFIEAGSEAYLEQALKNKALTLSTDYNPVAKADIVLITIGTPLDSNLNPSLEPVAGVIFDLSEHFKEGQLIIFRNILSPRILCRIKTLIEDKTGLKVGTNINLAFAPEITCENATIHELTNAPQPIGAFDEKSFKAAKSFFQTITKGKISFLTPEEALLAKLMNNMFSYVKAACANEFYLISESFGADIHKILDACNTSGINIPTPNANVAGPGVYKEGLFLVDRIPFSNLISTSFKINESMPAYIAQKLEGFKVNKVVILGMTNKPNSDDWRASLSYKLRKILLYQDYNVACYDPHLAEFSDSSVLQNADAVILMTPHNEFKDFDRIKNLINNTNCIYVDINGFWKELREQAKTSGPQGMYYSK